MGKKIEEKKYTLKEVEKMIDKLYAGKQTSEIGVIKLANMYDKIEDTIYPYSDNEAQEYLSGVMDELYQIIKKRKDWG
jgi:hypothetical protein